MAGSSNKRASVAIIGAGTQGRRLAYMWSSRGHNVHLIDAQPNQLKDSIQYIDDLQRNSKDTLDTPGQILTHSVDELANVLQDAWLVLECVPERIALKRTVLTNIEEVAPQDTIIASNSSSYAISEIIQELNLRHPERVLSAHSYWPPETNVLEVMGHATTNPEYISLVISEAERHGFQPFHVKKDSIGYIYNRIWAAIKREALLVAAEGAATPAEVDEIFKGVLKTPKGPFEQMDVVGLDVVYDIEQHYAEAREGIPQLPRDYLKTFIDNGKLGVKNGKGFYEYK